jgi:hypothetical protein
MAIYTQTQLTSASNATYITNASNLISAANVRTLNTDWISSSVLLPMTGSLTVLSSSFAISASYAPGQGATFPYSGSAQFTGSVGVTGSTSFQGGDFKVTDQGRNAEFDVDFVKINTQSGTQVTGSLNAPSITGSLQGTASWANNAISASFASNANNSISSSYASSSLSSSYAITASFALNAGGSGASFPYTGSAIISGSLIVTGSVQSNIFSGSVASSTASVDLNQAGVFTFTLNASGTTHFNFTNPGAGRTANLIVTTATGATASFSSNVKQPTGSLYTPSSGSGRIDILSALADGTNVYLTYAKTMV